ncbi:phosphoribosyltransferase-like protein [Suillus bovinus]|uniref:phosphoribosyltransferase-like protein n=1 Tax=Suillus bovinus TaxID=48563 RepID=UPI001B8729A2|nr:phosphoribosyltransferase-like protein [Suillus bovinus]KAG2157848.1 phosphoribosyltransferase-like protein [Suillus bovinus]
MEDPEHVRLTYNDIHNIIRGTSDKIASEFNPDMFIAIGGGGFFPARVLRTFLKDSSTKRNIPIQAIGLSLYESLPGTTAEQLGGEVVRTQWLGPDPGKRLLGRRALIIDEVDDTRKTLQYALNELQKDVEAELEMLPESERDSKRTKFAIFVVHNKLKTKLGKLPPDTPYFVGAEVKDVWLDYPWEAIDIEEHDRLAKEDEGRKTTSTN